jgi:hypothetical protein
MSDETEPSKKAPVKWANWAAAVWIAAVVVFFFYQIGLTLHLY